jgi:hypothetical protein
MKVTFRHFGEHLASSRYRALIPQRQLACLGVEKGRDWLVIGKHGWNFTQEAEGFTRVCFDVCDDHFSGQYAKHYIAAIERADLVTCNSQEMRRVIKEHTGAEAVVIPDPYEQQECDPRLHERLLWFGHSSNLADLTPWLEYLGEIEIVSNLKNVGGVTEWTPQSMERAFQTAGLVIIPTGKSMAKSANRAIESIRRGLFVVAGYLPAYADLGCYIGNIADGVEWALSHEREALKRVSASQRYIAAEYSPARIGELWLKALSN